MEALVSMIGEYTAYVIFTALFIFLFTWVLKHFKEVNNESKEREKNYQEIIKKLSDDLPHIRTALDEIRAEIRTHPPRRE